MLMVHIDMGRTAYCALIWHLDIVNHVFRFVCPHSEAQIREPYDRLYSCSVNLQDMFQIKLMIGIHPPTGGLFWIRQLRNYWSFPRLSQTCFHCTVEMLLDG